MYDFVFFSSTTLWRGVIIFQREVLILKKVYTDWFESFNLGKSGKRKYSICRSSRVA